MSGNLRAVKSEYREAERSELCSKGATVKELGGASGVSQSILNRPGFRRALGAASVTLLPPLIPEGLTS